MLPPDVFSGVEMVKNALAAGAPQGMGVDRGWTGTGSPDKLGEDEH